MNPFEPDALVAAMLQQLNTQSAWNFGNATSKVTAPAALPGTSVDQMINRVGALLSELGATIAPADLARLQQEYAQQLAALWQDMLAGKPISLEDRRFKAPAWQNSATHAYTAAAYLIHARYLTGLAVAVQAPKRVRQKLLFSVEQVVDAASPANFLATNPEALSRLIDTKGESLTQGLTHLLIDIQKGRISQNDDSAFEVGRNVATTEGQVVFENALFQLIQYRPLSGTVYQRPLLIVPPCINKFYILDLQPDNSLVRYALEQGHQVFLVSWVNPDVSMGQTTWDDYVELGVITAIQTVQAISAQPQINLLGFCVGGTLLSSALAVLAQRDEHPAASVTLLTTLLDFEDAGVLEVFVDEPQVELRESTIGQGGLMSGRDLGSAFSSLRPNDLVWNYVQANYLKGEEPPAFDLLFWNGDGTNLPGPMFCWYLRNTYLENSLKVPGKLTVAGEQLDLGRIDAPFFIYGSKEDHIVPWHGAFASLALLNPRQPKRNRFVLGASGHIAGVINPPAKMKRNYWTNAGRYQDPEQWLASASSHPGSWWPEWAAFLSSHAGKKIKPSAKLGAPGFKPIEAAPGRYVRVPC